ncbi:uncharacterized protein LOC134265646 [Saccostrea cucullata]|uniref:uncharacterized protein LOC134265646 n=1 Tax=Saccostrea cuccullata TaxID=36930 RepID=UPI002ED3591F
MFKCPLPVFGVRCQSLCHCPNESCHHVYGCKKASELLSTHRTSSGAYTRFLVPTKTSHSFERVSTYSSLMTNVDDASQETSDGKKCIEKMDQVQIKNASSSLIFSIVGLLIVAGLFLVIYICIILYSASAQRFSGV